MSLSIWEQFIIGAAVSFLTLLQSKLTNQVELDAIAATITFLQNLLAGKVGAASS